MNAYEWAGWIVIVAVIILVIVVAAALGVLLAQILHLPVPW